MNALNSLSLISGNDHETYLVLELETWQLPSGTSLLPILHMGKEHST